MELSEAFVKLLKSEQELKRLQDKRELDDYEISKLIAEAKNSIEKYEAECERIMKESGVVEDLIEGRLMNFKLCFSKPRKTVDVANIDAVPDEFVRIKREPMKKEIAEAYKNADTLPNWLQWKEGKSKFQYRVVKK